jgi:hypothetical protein
VNEWRLLSRLFLLVWFGQFIAQGPGPPHRPQGADGVADLADSAPTAKTLSARAVCIEPHLGHFTSPVEVIDLASFSKRFLQDLQLYS